MSSHSRVLPSAELSRPSGPLSARSVSFLKCATFYAGQIGTASGRLPLASSEQSLLSPFRCSRHAALLGGKSASSGLVRSSLAPAVGSSLAPRVLSLSVLSCNPQHAVRHSLLPVENIIFIVFFRCVFKSL